MARSNESGPLGGSVISVQIESDLLNELRNGRFVNSEKLPSEVELATAMSVSRTVIRDALADLEREGYVERVRGIGTVVNRHVVNLSGRLDQKFEFYDMIQASDHTPHTDSVNIQREFADSHLAEKLEIEVGQPVITVRKRILAEDRPVIWSVDYIAASLFPAAILDELDFSIPIFDILTDVCGANINSTIGHVSAVVGDKGIRERLDLRDYEALLLLEEVGYSKLTKPIIYSLTYYTSYFDFSLLRKKSLSVQKRSSAF